MKIPVDRKFVGIILIILGVVMCLTAAVVLLQHHRAVDAVPMVAAPGQPASSTPDVASYHVAPALPQSINIPAIGVSARVLELGLTHSGQIAVPANIQDTGWYNASAKPGGPGAMFVFGHVSNWQARGVFYNLKRLHKDDTVSITSGSGKNYTYRVVGTKTYAYNKVDMVAALKPINSKLPGLNLMTCAGKVINKSGEYSERLVVFTSLASN